jgi:2-oxoglutarate ferredoxin oxidoreductase subunit alpha
VKKFSIAIVGTGGKGVMSCGEMLLRLWARKGGKGFLRKVFGAQIRGGAAATIVNFTDDETYAADSRCDLLFVMDWEHFGRLQDEIRISRKTIIFCDDINKIPGDLLALSGYIHHVPLKALAGSVDAADSENVVALGVLSRIAGTGYESTAEEVKRYFRRADPQQMKKHLNALQVSRDVIVPEYINDILAPLYPHKPDISPPAWIATGNQMTALGTLATGVRFVAGYPITPATDILEWLAAPVNGFKGEMVQAEDELSAINMVIGASFGGVPSMTATSGPGLALMSESIGLAVASETPLTIVNVMRGGPSTGIPTKSEQSDLNIALYGQHGDAPHLVLAPCSIADCAATTQWAVLLAEQLQTVAIVLSDQLLGHSQAIISPPDIKQVIPARKQPFADGLHDKGYQRYALTPDSVSPMAIPGMCNRRYTAEGLEHTEAGIPSAQHAVHQQQLGKRLKKLQDFDYGARWAELSLWRDGKSFNLSESSRHREHAVAAQDDDLSAIALIGFGSMHAAMRQTGARLSADGHQVLVVCIRLLMPLQTQKLAALLENYEQCWVIEQNHGAQLFHYLAGLLDRGLQMKFQSLARSGPAPLIAEDIAGAIQSKSGAML